MNSTGERKSLTFIDFFAGAGGIRRGFELAGHKCVGFCEWDKYATMSYVSMHLLTDEQREYLAKLPKRERQKEILKSEYRNGEWYADDIRTVHAADLPRADVWCFGAPCQGFSIAGKRKGLDDDRSSLVREIFRLLDETSDRGLYRPGWLFYENVTGMLSSNKGFDFLAILLEMDKRGYDAEWQILDTQHFGVPQHRERVFTIGCLREKRAKKVLPIGNDEEATSHVQRQSVCNTLKSSHHVVGIYPTDVVRGGRAVVLRVNGFHKEKLLN